MELFKKGLFFFLLFSFLLSCQKEIIYTEIKDDKGHVVAKFNQEDSTGIVYSLDGKTYLSGKFSNQKKEGVWIEYSRDKNEKLFEWTYENDKKNGLYKGYTLTEKIQTIGYYKADKLDGVLVYFNLSGNPEKVEVWKAIGDSEGTSELVFSKEIK